MSDIPLARRLLAEVAPHIPEAQRPTFNAALAALWRRAPSKPRAPVRSRYIDPVTAAAIRAYSRANPTAHLQDIAVLFRTNAGRVSEALRRER